MLTVVVTVLCLLVAVGYCDALDFAGAQQLIASTCGPEDTVFKCLCFTPNIDSFYSIYCNFTDENWQETGTVIIPSFHCISYIDSGKEELIYGVCPFGRQPSPVTLAGSVTIEEAIKNKMICGSGREGMLCGSCSDNHSLLFNSYLYDCVPNEKCRNGFWALYIIQQILSTLFFFALFTFFDTKKIQSYMNGFIFGAQIMSFQMSLLVIYDNWSHVAHLSFPNNSTFPETLTTLFASVSSIWNLNIYFGSPSYCIQNQLSALPSMALDYLTGVLPILVLLASYTATELHRRNYIFIVKIWQPFHICCTRGRRLFNTSSSLMDFMAIFVTLSFSKFVAISFMLLAPSPVYNSTSFVYFVYLYDGNIPYFGAEHIPYAMLALIVLIFFVIPLPLLLILYPMACFQRFLNRFHLRKYIITAFTDALQGPFKDGSDNSQDCRYFAAVYFILRIVIIGSFCMFFTATNALVMSILVSLLVTLLLIAWHRPYKHSPTNKMEAAIITYFIFFVLMTNFIRVSYLRKPFCFIKMLMQVVLYIMLFGPSVCVVVIVLYSCGRTVYQRAYKPAHKDCAVNSNNSLEVLITDYQEGIGILS